MHRTVLPLAVLTLALLALPHASAQAPEPGDVVAAVCALDPAIEENLAVCPREEPAAPQPEEAADAAHDHGAPPAVDEPAGAAQAVADEATDAAGDAADDPQGAPERVVAFLATLLQFVRDLLEIPVVGFRASLDAAAALVGGAIDATHGAAQAAAGAGAATGDALGAAASAVGGAIGGAIDAVAALFAPAPAPDAPVALPEGAPTDALPARGALDALLGAVDGVAPA